MHVSFMPYGKRAEVELLFRDMEAQKHFLIMHKEGQPDMGIWLQSQLRMLPLGVWEYVFPKEELALVLTTLGRAKGKADNGLYNFGWLQKFILQKLTQSDPIPKDYKTDAKYLWVKDNVNIILIGIKNDGDMTEGPENKYAGWTHEAI